MTVQLPYPLTWAEPVANTAFPAAPAVTSVKMVLDGSEVQGTLTWLLTTASTNQAGGVVMGVNPTSYTIPSGTFPVGNVTNIMTARSTATSNFQTKIQFSTGMTLYPTSVIVNPDGSTIIYWDLLMTGTPTGVLR